MADEIGLIQNVPPSPDDEWLVRDDFVNFLTAHAAVLEIRYGIGHTEEWGEDQITRQYAPKGSNKHLAYVHLEKMWEELKNTLVETGLAEIGRMGDYQWVGMHPKIANVYMTALAEHMSSIRGWYPITDDTLDQLAVSGFSMERLSRALLDEPRIVSYLPTEQEVKMELANVCLATVIPRNVAEIPIEKIIKLRRDHETEFIAFQNYLDDFRAKVNNLTGISSREALIEHLELQYNKILKPCVEEVRKAFALMNVETATSIANANFAVPSTIAGAAAAFGLSVNPVIGGIAGFALSMIPTIQKRRDTAQDALKKPGSWLLRVEEGLKPKDFISRVQDSARKFVLNV